MPSVSAYIIAFNEEAKIEAAVRSVQWADEIVLVDSKSTDRTAAIAEGLGARVVQVPFEGYGMLRKRAVESCSGDWIFSLDADERCTPEAEEEIRRIVASPDARDAYFVPRRSFFMGRWIRHCGWYPDFRQPQLFKKGALTYAEDLVHERYTVSGSTDRLENFIWQVPYKDLSELIRKADRYSSLGTDKLAKKGVRGGMGKALLHGLGNFIRIYLLKLGFLDGWAGFMIAYGNFEGTFYRYAKLAEKQQGWGDPPAAPPAWPQS